MIQNAETTQCLSDSISFFYVPDPYTRRRVTEQAPGCRRGEFQGCRGSKIGGLGHLHLCTGLANPGNLVFLDPWETPENASHVYYYLPHVALLHAVACPLSSSRSCCLRYIKNLPLNSKGTGADKKGQQRNWSYGAQQANSLISHADFSDPKKRSIACADSALANSQLEGRASRTGGDALMHCTWRAASVASAASMLRTRDPVPSVTSSRHRRRSQGRFGSFL